MEVYLVPHPEGDTAGDGASQRHARAVVALFQQTGVAPDCILTSPLSPARQTTEGLVAALGDVRPTVTECPPLAPGGDPAELTRYIRENGGNAVVLVGGEPDLCAYAARLIGGEHAEIDLGDGAVAAITFRGILDEGKGALVWVIPAGRAETEPPAG